MPQTVSTKSFFSQAFVSVTNMYEMRAETNDMSEPALRDYIAFAISAVPEVDAVFTCRQDKVCHVWAIVHSSESDVRKRIYAKERNIIEKFEGFDFDFNIIASRGRDPRSIVRDPGAELAFRR